MKTIIKYAVDDMWKHKITVLFLLIQVVISIILVYNTIISILDLNESKKILEEINVDQNVYFSRDNTSHEHFTEMLENEQTYLKKTQELYNFITNPELDITAFSFIDRNVPFKDKFDNYSVYIDEDHNINYVQGFAVDTPFFEYFNLTIEGDQDIQNINTPFIPVILGNDFKKEFAINDIFENYIGDEYIVKGFFKKGSAVINPKVDRNQILLDQTIIVPILIDSNSLTNYDEVINRTYYYTENPSILGEIAKLSSDLHLYDFSFKSLSEQTKIIVEDKLIWIQFQLILSSMIGLVSTITVTISLLQYINKNFHNILIHMLLGCSKIKTFFRIFTQVVFFFTVGNGICLWLYDNYAISFVILIYSIIMMALISIIPILKIKGMKLNTLLRSAR